MQSIIIQTWITESIPTDTALGHLGPTIRNHFAFYAYSNTINNNSFYGLHRRHFTLCGKRLGIRNERFREAVIYGIIILVFRAWFQACEGDREVLPIQLSCKLRHIGSIFRNTDLDAVYHAGIGIGTRYRRRSGSCHKVLLLELEGFNIRIGILLASGESQQEDTYKQYS